MYPGCRIEKVGPGRTAAGAHIEKGARVDKTGLLTPPTWIPWKQRSVPGDPDVSGCRYNALSREWARLDPAKEGLSMNFRAGMCVINVAYTEPHGHGLSGGKHGASPSYCYSLSKR